MRRLIAFTWLAFVLIMARSCRTGEQWADTVPSQPEPVAVAQAPAISDGARFLLAAALACATAAATTLLITQLRWPVICALPCH